jgi:uncharacterized protein (AIM24 family)
MIDFVKATLITGEHIFINELKIEAVWLEKEFGKEFCMISLENGERIKIKPEFFYNWINKKPKVKE